MSQKIIIAGAQANALHSYSEEEKTAFVEFINQQLSDDPDLKDVIPVNSASDDIFKAVHDGILISKLINVAKADTIDERALNKKNLNIYKIHENNRAAVSAAKAIGCSVVNIGAEDIIKGNPMLIFSLLWQVIRIKLTSKINLIDHPELYRLLEDGESLEDFLKLPPEQILLRWFNYHLKNAGHPRRVNNFSGDVSDSENYTVLLAKIAPELCNRDPLQETDTLKRADLVLGNSEKLGVKRFIKPSDIVSGNSRLNLSFVAQLFNTWPALAPLEDKALDKLKILIEEDDSSDNREERAFRNWVNNIGIDKHVNSLFSDLSDGIALLQIIDKLQPGIVQWNKVYQPPQTNMVFKRNENCVYAIKLATQLKCSLVGISGSDLGASHKKYTLAIVWQLRRAHLLNYLKKMATNTGKEFTEASVIDEANRQVRSGGKATQITTFSDPLIKNSRFLLDLIYSIEPRAIDEAIYRPDGSEEDNKLNAKYAIAAARKIGASIFCLWEDIVEGNPKMVLTFLGAVLAEGHPVQGE